MEATVLFWLMTFVGENWPWHRYVFEAVIRRESTPSCDDACAEKVYDYVNSRDVPFGESPDPGPKMLPVRKPRTAWENRKRQTFTNFTKGGHVYHQGMMHFATTPASPSPGGYLILRVEGEGTGGAPHTNNSWGTCCSSRLSRGPETDSCAARLPSGPF